MAESPEYDNPHDALNWARTQMSPERRERALKAPDIDAETRAEVLRPFASGETLTATQRVSDPFTGGAIDVECDYGTGFSDSDSGE